MTYTKEKLDYLRKNTSLSPFAAIKINRYKKSELDQEKIDELEYEMRLAIFADRYYKLWKRLEWGEKEGESLQDFAESEIDRVVSENGITR